MTNQLIFDPLVPWPVIWAVAAIAAVLVFFALWRGLRGWWLRGLGAIALLAALVQPALQREDRNPLSDIVLMVVDQSSSQALSDRADQTAQATQRLAAEIAALPNTELRQIIVEDGEQNAGSLVLTALAEALAEEPSARVAGAFLVTDGQVHDLDVVPQIPAPLHVLLTGREVDWDRRLRIQTAPAFGIIGEPVTIQLMVEEQGNLPAGERGRDVSLTISIDGGQAETYSVPPNEALELPVTLDHGGQNVVQFNLEVAEEELTDRNNAAVVQINGVRDRLRVLLVSGEPHAGERTWRNLLKSDPSVDLVHFTILRPQDKHDNVPAEELSLIAFPTHELFIEKIDEFDLIIFDRYRRRDILPSAYLSSIRDYVVDGGAILLSAGPEYATVNSLAGSAIGEIMPGAPTRLVLEQPFTPLVTDMGQRHPVTEGLEDLVPPSDEEDMPGWGRWLRIVELADVEGQVVMSGLGDRPLLALNRVGDGRVALLASDHAWLWARGFEGGGPQQELLRRLAHWMMKEPDLEEEALTVTAEGQTMTITRRSLTEGAREVTITTPDGSTVVLPLEETAPGRYTTTWEAPDIGLYRLADGDLERVMALGPSAPREFEETIATGDKLAPVIDPMGGDIQQVENGVPDIRTVREGRPAAGRGWMGITPREAYLTADIRVSNILPAWAFLLIASFFAVAAWLREGRR